METSLFVDIAMRIFLFTRLYISAFYLTYKIIVMFLCFMLSGIFPFSVNWVSVDFYLTSKSTFIWDCSTDFNSWQTRRKSSAGFSVHIRYEFSICQSWIGFQSSCTRQIEYRGLKHTDQSIVRKRLLFFCTEEVYKFLICYTGNFSESTRFPHFIKSQVYYAL